MFSIIILIKNLIKFVKVKNINPKYYLFLKLFRPSSLILQEGIILQTLKAN